MVSYLLRTCIWIFPALTVWTWGYRPFSALFCGEEFPFLRRRARGGILTIAFFTEFQHFRAIAADIEEVIFSATPRPAIVCAKGKTIVLFVNVGVPVHQRVGEPGEFSAGANFNPWKILFKVQQPAFYGIGMFCDLVDEKFPILHCRTAPNSHNVAIGCRWV